MTTFNITALILIEIFIICGQICDSEKLALTLAEKQDSANNNSDKQEDGEKDLTCVLVQVNVISFTNI